MGYARALLIIKILMPGYEPGIFLPAIHLDPLGRQSGPITRELLKLDLLRHRSGSTELVSFYILFLGGPMRP